MRQATRVPLRDLWPNEHPLIGMIHLMPLPGSPRWRGSMSAVLDRATADAAALRSAGFDGLLVENYGDAPFHPRRVPSETIAAIAIAAAAIRSAADLPLGVNVLRNDNIAALGIAAATGARFIRCNIHVGGMWTDQGWLEGRAHQTLRRRAALDVDVAIFADLFVKHAVPPPGLTVAAAARDAWDRGLADALILTGPATGVAPDRDRFRDVRRAAPDAPVLIGSGLGLDDGAGLFDLADGAIVGSAVQVDGRAGSGVDGERARRLVRSVRGGRTD